MGPGFYSYDGETLHHAPNFVEHKDFQLYKEQKDTYTYPTNGWDWFDTVEAACEAYHLDPTPYQEEPK